VSPETIRRVIRRETHMNVPPRVAAGMSYEEFLRERIAEDAALKGEFASRNSEEEERIAMQASLERLAQLVKGD